MKCHYCIKFCSKCKKILVENKINFHKCKNCKYGLNSICLKCEKAYKSEYYSINKEDINNKNKKFYEDHKDEVLLKCKEYYEKNKEKRKEYARRYREEHLEECREKGREYQRKNKDIENERCRLWYKDNKDHVIEYNKRYNEENPHIKINSHHKRRQLKDSQGDGITKEQWLEMMKFFDFKCAYSGEILNKDTRSVDHIISLTKEGVHEIWNCVPMLKVLNSSKSSNDMVHWYKQQNFFDINRLMKIYEWQEYAFEKWGVKYDA